MRRRLLWGGVFVLIAGSVAGLIVAFPSPGPPKGSEMTTIEGDIVEAQKAKPFSPRKGEILGIAQKFVFTAVTRHNVADSWDLVCPSLKKGYTRKSWAKGDIPVVPFPVKFGRWRVGYSFEKEVDLQVALFPPKKSGQRPTVFDLTVERCNPRGSSHWLVAQFAPAPGPGGDFGERRTRFGNLTPAGKPPTPPKRTGTVWLLLPAGIFALLVGALAALGIRSLRTRRAYRAYFRDRQISSSRPS